MKAVLSHRIYMDVEPDVKESISKILTYKIPPRMPNQNPEIIKNMARIRSNLVSIPIGRTDLIPEGYEIVDKRILVPTEFPEFRFELRDSQKEVYNAVDDNCIVNAWVSWGKTFSGLAIAGKLAQKTLVVTHTTALREQWIDEVRKVYGIEPGIIGSGQFNTDAPIVVGNTQSLFRKIPQIQKEFGTLILDEMHHVSSPTFARIVDTSYARYKIGLSGTIQRKDGKHVVFRDYFGNTVFQPPKENYMTPSVDVVRSEVRFPDGDRMPWAKRINMLTYNEEYQHLVAMLAAAYAQKGHKVLVVSDRVHFLRTCAELVGDRAICVTGTDKGVERKKLVSSILSGEKEILFGTQAIFSEGISVNNLSCLILGTPVNNEPLLTQLVGRVIREDEGKLPPKIVDIHLKGNTARKQAANRMGHYIKQGYNVREL